MTICDASLFKSEKVFISKIHDLFQSPDQKLVKNAIWTTELSELYEKKVFDYAKLSGILRKQACLFEKVISSSEEGLRFDPEYFRVGFYGQGFPLFLRVSFF